MGELGHGAEVYGESASAISWNLNLNLIFGRYNDNGGSENGRHEISSLPLFDLGAGNGAGA